MRLSSPHPTLRAENGCVVSYCAVASAVGARILREGGNAIDAAVATALALAVTYPQAGNLGGGGFMLLRRGNGEVLFLDYRETAPRAIRAELFAGASAPQVVGALPVGIPGTVAGLGEALARHGTMGWDRVIAPAIDLAEQGTWLTTRQSGYLELHHSNLAHFESTRRCFTAGDRPLLPGTLFRQPDLARTLRRLAHDGPQAFYRGAVADLIVAEMERSGGVLDDEDLAGYLPRWRTPLERSFCGRRIVTAPLPSGGGLVVQLALGMIEACSALREQPSSVERFALYARAFRVAFAVCNQLAADPDHLSPAEREEEESLATRAYSSADLERFEQTFLPRAPRVAARRSDTTHFCILDGAGNAVSNTYSLNTLFGSKLTVGDAGFLLNNSLDDFGIAAGSPNWYELVHGERNWLAPGRRPVSSMAPTLVLSDGAVELVLGGSGGPRIPTLVAQVILAVIGDELTLEQAIRMPRVHHQFVPDELAVEASMPEAIALGLAHRGFPISRLPMLGIGVGIHRAPASGQLAAALDARFSFE